MLLLTIKQGDELTDDEMVRELMKVDESMAREVEELRTLTAAQEERIFELEGEVGSCDVIFGV